MGALLQSRAIQAHFDTLIVGTKSDRERIANQCYSKGLIPAVLTESPDMVKIIHTIQDRISTDRTGSAFSNFLEILCYDTATEHLAETLRDTLERLRQSPLETSPYGMPQDTVERLRRSPVDTSPYETLQDTVERLRRSPLETSPHGIVQNPAETSSGNMHGMYASPFLRYNTGTADARTIRGGSELENITRSLTVPTSASSMFQPRDNLSCNPSIASSVERSSGLDLTSQRRWSLAEQISLHYLPRNGMPPLTEQSLGYTLSLAAPTRPRRPLSANHTSEPLLRCIAAHRKCQSDDLTSGFTLPSLTGHSGGFDLPLAGQRSPPTPGFTLPSLTGHSGGFDLPLAGQRSPPASGFTLPSLTGHSGGFDLPLSGQRSPPAPGFTLPSLTGHSGGFDLPLAGQRSPPAEQCSRSSFYAGDDRDSLQLVRSGSSSSDTYETGSIEDSYTGSEEESPLVAMIEKESITRELEVHRRNYNISGIVTLRNEDISSAVAESRIQEVKVQEQSYCSNIISAATGNEDSCLTVEIGRESNIGGESNMREMGVLQERGNCNTTNFPASTGVGGYVYTSESAFDHQETASKSGMRSACSEKETSADTSPGKTTGSGRLRAPTATSMRNDERVVAEVCGEEETEHMLASKDESGYSTTLSRKTSSDSLQDVQVVCVCEPSEEQLIKKSELLDHGSANSRKASSTGTASPVHEMPAAEEGETGQLPDRGTATNPRYLGHPGSKSTSSSPGLPNDPSVATSQLLDQGTATNPRYLGHPTCSGSKITSSSPGLPNDPSVEEVATRLEACELENQDAVTVGCCDHLQEIESLSTRLELLKAERESERGYLISICMEKDSMKTKRDVLKTRLRGLKSKTRKQAKKLQELEGKMAELSSHEAQSAAQREHIAKLTQQIMYMEAFCNETQAEMIRAQEELVSARTRLAEHTERERSTKERFAALEKSLQASATEGYLSRKETDGLKRRVKILEKLIWRFDGRPGRRDETDDPGDAEDTSDTMHTIDTNTLERPGRILKRANTM